MLDTLKTALQYHKQRAIDAYRADGQPYTFFRLYGQAVEEVLQRLWATHFLGEKWCLLAIGGFGRNELYPYSDIDLALVSCYALNETQQQSIIDLVQQMWDLSLAPSLKSGSLKELLISTNEDLSAQTAFLEARYLVGDEMFAQEVLTAFRQQMDVVVFTENKLLEMKQRHAKQPALVLEPNIKNGAGGLRDIHLMMWLAQAQGVRADFRSLKHNKILTRTETKLLRTCHRRLARLRIELHLAANRAEDHLIFDLQQSLAKTFQLNDENTQSGVEHLMRIFYRTAKSVLQLNGILLPILHERLCCDESKKMVDIDKDYYQVGTMLAIKDKNLFHQQPEHILKAVELLQHNRHLHSLAPITLRAWWAALRNVGRDLYQNPVNRERFLRFFKTGDGLTHTIRFLNLYGLLSEYLPTWHKIVGLLQHDLFHIYPVDDHILTVLRNIRRFAMEQHSHEMPIASAIFQNFPQEKQYILYLAALFHDIAKGRDGDHAQEGVADAKQFACDHFMSEQDCDLLCFLVKNHLLMSLTAQKEDIQDPAVIERFVQKIHHREHLDALYLLTIADIRGTNPKIWNSWRAQLLNNLYQNSLRILSGEFTSQEHTALTRRQHALSTLIAQQNNEKQLHQLIHDLGDAYFVRHSTEVITWHLQQLSQHGTNTPTAAIRPLNADTIQVMVYMPNDQRLFTRLCRIIGQYGLSIAAARAFITEHHFILDTFGVTLPENRDATEIINIQAALLSDLQRFVCEPYEIYCKTHHKPSRRARLQPITPDVLIYPDEEHSEHFCIEIIAIDRPYLLADLTEVLAQHRINLIYAKITTLAERVEDSFIVTSQQAWNVGLEYALKRDLLAQLS